MTNAQMALSLLRSVKKKVGENIQVYSEMILSQAEEAYHNQGGDIVERQLIDIFVDGLTNDGLKMKILRDQPNILQGAIAISTNEQNLRNRVQTSHTTQHTQTTSGHTPMKVDHSWDQWFRSRFNWIKSTQHDRSVVRCWNCNVMGHYSRECKEKQYRPPAGHGRPRVNNQSPQGHRSNNHQEN